MTKFPDKILFHKFKEESHLREVLKNAPEYREQLEERVAELDDVLKHGENRCHASRDQRNYLKRILATT